MRDKAYTVFFSSFSYFVLPHRFPSALSPLLATGATPPRTRRPRRLDRSAAMPMQPSTVRDTWTRIARGRATCLESSRKCKGRGKPGSRAGLRTRPCLNLSLFRCRRYVAGSSADSTSDGSQGFSLQSAIVGVGAILAAVAASFIVAGFTNVGDNLGAEKAAMQDKSLGTFVEKFASVSCVTAYRIKQRRRRAWLILPLYVCLSVFGPDRSSSTLKSQPPRRAQSAIRGRSNQSIDWECACIFPFPPPTPLSIP